MALSANEMREKIKAVVIVQATPLNWDGNLDLEGLKVNPRFWGGKMQRKAICLGVYGQ